MVPIAEILPPLTIGLAFTALSTVKVYGLVRGIEGGGRKPLQQRVCGT